MSDWSERPAEPGELCTCGRHAVVVYNGERWGPLGYCGIPGMRPVLPCTWCGSTTAHDPARCPAYTLTAPTNTATTEAP